MRIKGWYQEGSDRAPSTACITINRIMAEQVTLYQKLPLLGDKTMVTLELFETDNWITDESDTEWAVQCL